MNVSLLTKWWWKLEKESGLWQTIVRYKYLKKDSVVDVSHKQSDSAMWADVLKVNICIYKAGKLLCIMVKTHFFGKTFGCMINPCVCFSLIYSNSASNRM